VGATWDAGVLDTPARVRGMSRGRNGLLHAGRTLERDTAPDAHARQAAHR